MPSTGLVNQLTVVHRDSGGTVMFMPDVCLTPMPGGGQAPIPYPNTATSQDTAQGSTTVTCDGNPLMLQGSVFSKSTGDEPGSGGGVVSHTTKGAAQFINYSFDVQIEGKCVPRLGDTMLGNKASAFNTPPAPEVQPPATVPTSPGDESKPDKLTFLVKDNAGKPVANAKFKVIRPDGSETEGQTDGNGKADLGETFTSLCSVVFPEHERSEKVDTQE